MRRFNVTGLCVSHKHYMVDISGKLAQIKGMVDRGDYFTINRARQYGKTTTLHHLEEMLKDEYTVVSISFEGIDDEGFGSPESFCPMFIRQIVRALEFTSEDEEYISRWADKSIIDFELLSRHITKMCKGKKIVLMIDEVDKTSNNRVFLHFLGMLRDKFLARERGKEFTFQSVILAGVYDIRNIKLKLISEGGYTPSEKEGKIYNSPWNIAVDYEVDMSFKPDEIATMLSEYEADHKTGMDIASISEEIYKYTSGYPFLVSRICQRVDEKLDSNWTLEGVQDAVKTIINEKSTLSDDMFKNLENYADLYNFAYEILFYEPKDFIIHDPLIEFGIMFGFFKNSDGKVAISNKIFELMMADYFVSKKSRSNSGKQITGVLQYDVVKNDRFDMELCLRKFAEHYAEIFNPNNEQDIEFLERHGRMLFLSYLRPLINGQGFYHIESQFTDLRRMDIVVDFAREQFIIELKIWHGDKYKEGAYKQLLGYMASKNADTGYMLTFDFRKGKRKIVDSELSISEPSAQWVEFDGKRIFDVVV